MEAYIIFEGDINTKNTSELSSVLLKIAEAKNPPFTKINIFLSSTGGSIYYGFALATIIQNSKIPVAIHATNHIDSIANVIFMSSKERTAESHAKFYMHGASQSGRFYQEDLLEQLQSIKNHNDRIASFISENSTIDLKKVKNIMKKRGTLGVGEALSLGLISQILHKTVPKDAFRYDIISIED